MHLVDQLKKAASEALFSLYQVSVPPSGILVNATKPEFEGNYTVVLFAFVKELKLSPDALGEALGNHLVSTYPHLFTAHNTIKGFLNITISDAFWHGFINNTTTDQTSIASKGKTIMVEYSSPWSFT
ncbi:MAG: hypothetical protein ACO21S_06885 [Sediminibacterium sp.]